MGEQSFGLAFALSGPEGSNWMSAVDCDADHRRSPFCFASFAARLDTDRDGKWSVKECEEASSAASAVAAIQSAAASQQRGDDQDSKEGAQTAKRRQIGAALAQRLVAAGTYEIGDPNIGVYFPKEQQPWYFKPAAGEEPFKITGYIYTGICVLWFLAMLFLRYTKDSFDHEDSFLMTVALQAIALALWFFYDFSFMCARFNWLLTDEKADYEVWSTDYGGAEEVICWLGPDWFRASNETLVQHECPTIEKLFKLDAQPVPDDACNFGPALLFSADILR